VVVDRRAYSLIVLSTAVGLGSVTVANVASHDGWTYGHASIFFWLGLLLIFAPNAAWSIRARATRRERFILVLLLGVALYVVKILASPHGFTFGDEYIHLRNVNNLLRTHHLFANNPLLPTAAYYPGLGAITAGLTRITGLSAFAAGLMVVGAARLVLSASLFHVAARVTRSERAASVACLVYMANPMFLFFNATFTYENLALPLAAFATWWIARTRQRHDLVSLAAATLAIAAVTVTHHVVGLALSALLVTWWLVEWRSDRLSAERLNVGILAALSSVATVVWLFAVARPAASYLFSRNIFPALRQTGWLLLGHVKRRHLYSSGGLVAPIWEPVAGFLGTAILLTALVFALRRLWPARHQPPIAVIGVIAVAYPVSLIPRLAPTGIALSGRMSEYIYVGLGCALGPLAVDLVRSPSRRRSKLARWHASTDRIWQQLADHKTSAGAALLTIVFVGDVTIGTAFYQRLTETARPSGYPSRVQVDVVNASNWARDHLGVSQPFGASLTDSFALATAGEQNPISQYQVWPIFFAPTMNDTVVRAIKATGVRYLLIDWRMTRGVPPSPGYYFDPFEPGASKYEQSFPSEALRKFTEASACTRALYSVGAVQIVDVSAISDGTCVPG
jgi:hypothetical protein